MKRIEVQVERVKEKHRLHVAQLKILEQELQALLEEHRLVVEAMLPILRNSHITALEVTVLHVVRVLEVIIKEEALLIIVIEAEVPQREVRDLALEHQEDLDPVLEEEEDNP